MVDIIKAHKILKDLNQVNTMLSLNYLVLESRLEDNKVADNELQETKENIELLHFMISTVVEATDFIEFECLENKFAEKFTENKN